MVRWTYAANLLATAFLNGVWTTEQLDLHGRFVLGLRSPSKWFSKLVAKIIVRYPARPTSFRLLRTLRHLIVGWELAPRLERLKHPSYLRLSRPVMGPAPGWCPSATLPQLTTPGDLADWLQITAGELQWFADRFAPADKIPDGPLRHYRYKHLRKSSGGMRLLEIPKPRLKQIQQQILHGILDQIPPHAAAHAFCKGRSVATYVAPHAGQQIVLHLDLQDFFPSLGAGRVQALLRTIGYPDRIARLLTALCTHRARNDAFTTVEGEVFDTAGRRKYRERHLPQGAPTSPALANLCAWRLDVRLTALATRFGATYTRYADDLLFSGGDELRRGMSRFRMLVLAIALDEGFEVHSRKTRVLLQSQSQRVAGVILNEHPNPARHDFDQLKALLFNCVRHGPDSQNRDQRTNFAQHLLGRIAYLTMINPHRGGKLKALFDQVQWKPSGCADAGR